MDDTMVILLSACAGMWNIPRSPPANDRGGMTSWRQDPMQGLPLWQIAWHECRLHAFDTDEELRCCIDDPCVQSFLVYWQPLQIMQYVKYSGGGGGWPHIGSQYSGCSSGVPGAVVRGPPAATRFGWPFYSRAVMRRTLRVSVALSLSSVN
jgi:hypothetical protein